eukprot:scaffold1744_cov237-Chaetoceros_neogracile.AAC.3
MHMISSNKNPSKIIRPYVGTAFLVLVSSQEDRRLLKTLFLVSSLVPAPCDQTEVQVYLSSSHHRLKGTIKEEGIANIRMEFNSFLSLPDARLSSFRPLVSVRMSLKSQQGTEENDASVILQSFFMTSS